MAELGQISKNNAYTAQLRQMFIKDKLGQISYNFFCDWAIIIYCLKKQRWKVEIFEMFRSSPIL